MHRSNVRFSLLPQLIALALASYSLAGLGQDSSDPAETSDRLHGSSHDHDLLEEVIVTATPLSRNVIEMSQSATVLSGAALDREVANNLGDTLARIPGLSNASFGQNVGRPVIRGFEGARVGVLNNNMGAADASAVSQDHAVAVEPFLADQIEVLRGPATLLYGSGAIGGVVNMVTHTIPEEIPEDGHSGRAMLQLDSAANQRMGAARLDLGQGNWALHANGFYRRTDDYDIPGEADLYHDEEEHEHEDEHDHEGEHGEEQEEAYGILENSFLDNEGGSLGASWIGDRWRAGMSFTRYSSDYGIPGGHGHHGEEDEEHHDDDDHDEDHDDEHEDEHGEELVSIGLESNRLDGEIVGTQPFRGFEQFKLRVAKSDYTHTEYEGEEIGTIFNNETIDSRVELRHVPWGIWKGAFGAQYSHRDFEAIGDEAFVPPSSTKTAALFWVESAELGDWQFDTGLRYDDISVKTDEGLQRDFNPFTASVGAVWHVTESGHLTFNASRAERAPTDQELFADGPHLATQTFEFGDPTLDTEKNLHLEAGFRLHQGKLTGSITLFADNFSDYIYQLDTGEEEDELPVRLWSQQDADFQGAELELRYDLGRFSSGHWQLSGFADTVRAELSDNSNVPRIPPKRIGLAVDWDHKSWVGNISWVRAASHTRIADYETRTPGYDLLNADLSYLLPIKSTNEWEVFAKGHNLLDDDIRNSTSFLKDQAPQIGRNFVLGIRAYF